MNKKFQLLSIVIVLVVAVILRFYNFTNIPFTHDEFSTLLRLNYGSLADLVEYGVKQLDNHPAGHQVFTYAYTKMFGQSAPVVKLINLLFGVLSVFLIYLLGKNWFNRSAGLFAASLFASLQYTVVHSQIARMYGFGILFVLLSAWFMYSYVSKKGKISSLIGFVLATAAAMYSHYFSFLEVGLVGLIGFLFAQGSKRWYVFIAGLMSILLFSPHFNVLIFQLSKGGIEDWLGSFSYSFFSNYFMYAFNRSWLVIGVLLSIILLSIQVWMKPKQRPYRWISFVLFITPIIIGAVYSIMISNLLHSKVLFFSFPFLLLFLASFIKPLQPKKELLMVIVILMVNMFTLIYGRKHYELFYNHRYGLVAESCQEWTTNINSDDLTIFKVSYKPADEYYYKTKGLTFPETIYADSIYSVKTVDSIIKNLTTEYLFYGAAVVNNPTYLAIAKHYYPHIVSSKYGSSAEVYLLKKGEPNLADKECVNFVFENSIEQTGNGIDSILVDTYNTQWGILSGEYALTQAFYLDSISFSNNNILELSVDAFSLDSLGGMLLVSQIEKDGEKIDWRSAKFDDFISNEEQACVLLTVKLPDIIYPKGCMYKFYLWNPNKAQYGIRNISFKVRAGNPFTYGGTREIPKDLTKYCLD